MDISEVLKALADPNRLRILNLLGDRTLCVCDIEALLKINQSNLSRHLSKLKQAGLVHSQKKGLFMHYSRAELPGAYGPVIADLYRAMAKDTQWEADRQFSPGQQTCGDGDC